MKGIILGLSAMLALAGCGASPEQQARYDAKERLWELKSAARDAQSAMEECSPEYNSHIHSYTQAALCSNERVLAVWRGAKYPYMDLLQLMSEARISGARQVDNGQIAADAYTAQLADLGKRVSMEAMLRELEKAAPVNSVSPTQARAIRKAALLRGLSAFDGVQKAQQGTDPSGQATPKPGPQQVSSTF